ncbi:Tex family protein [Caproiciproducens faecalis]|uniref:RNA-binding transcriptional accessory protein n=1 Tax=Caproiciproducens faecalis TaxID=2820301 RepID=A0ABS7DND8_9FIRM|nr:Tex family protein [Caproiciproducens faecalis]MBW7572816.1 RNA-binding transcriptional accessory protein [Caproiciproducens faecalis]
MDFALLIAEQFHLQQWQVEKVIELIDEGNTIPFIARYRKEAHGSLDDQMLREISERLEYLRALQKRREEVTGLITAAECMTEEIAAALAAAVSLSEIDDIYRPFRPKRKTRASVAKAKGLEPLADTIFEQKKDSAYPIDLAESYVNVELGVETPEDALAGALDIIAERISDDAGIRKRLRVVAMAQGEVVSKAAKPDEDSVYAQYYDFRQPAAKIAGHRVLAIDRGEREEFLKVSVELDRLKGLNIVYSTSVKENSPCTEAVRQAGEDAYDRLIFPSIEREIRNALTEAAAESAIKVFSVNLRQLLMQPPVKNRVAMGLDPGYRTGCKVAVVDPTGRVLDTGVIYPTHSQAKVEEAKKAIANLILKYKVEVIAIGNGTASKETEMFAADVIKGLHSGVSYMVVSEAGASVYSASKLAAQEFPEFDVTLRSAVSIARRLQDPLAELVKIDPKAIGVGQYQHDMPKKQLDEALGGVVEDCVNTVGVDLNTASPSLLEKIAGISAAVSKNIVAYREENGAFHSRSELKKVPKLGPKAFEQCAGFLRVAESKNILDNTAVHPESYDAAKALLSLCDYDMNSLKKNGIGDLKGRVEKIGTAAAAQKLGIGVPTLSDIVTELLRPGRDPRDELPAPLLRTDVLSMEDLKPGMELSGTVRNVIDFGAFVDIGVHQDGLVHISQICDKFIKHPSEVLKVGDVVKVRVLSVDTAKKRIALTMKSEEAAK